MFTACSESEGIHNSLRITQVGHDHAGSGQAEFLFRKCAASGHTECLCSDGLSAFDVINGIADDPGILRSKAFAVVTLRFVDGFAHDIGADFVMIAEPADGKEVVKLEVADFFARAEFHVAGAECERGLWTLREAVQQVQDAWQNFFLLTVCDKRGERSQVVRLKGGIGKFPVSVKTGGEKTVAKNDWIRAAVHGDAVDLSSRAERSLERGVEGAAGGAVEVGQGAIDIEDE